jgi:uncharacterized protein with HEPN domain
MSRRDWTLFVADMLEACDKIIDYTSGMSFDAFCADTRTVDAVVRNLEIIGEASKGIPDEKKCLKPEVDWAAIKGLRNRSLQASPTLKPSTNSRWIAGLNTTTWVIVLS